MTDFARTQARLDYEFEDSRFMNGAQLVVEVDGERVLDVARGDNGLGAPIDAEHIFRVYCTIKPVLAVGVASLVDAGACSLDDPVVAHLPDMQRLEGVTIRHVMTHTAGLHELSGVGMEMAGPAHRREIVASAPRPAGWQVGRDAGYSEFAGWHVLGWIVESVTDLELRDFLRTRVLDPLGLSQTYVGMTSDEYREVAPRIGVNCDLRNLQSFPMLYERNERVCTETNPAHGGYTNARDLARFYSALLARLSTSESDESPAAEVLRQFCTTQRPATFDVVLDRVCPYGLGFMTSLAQHDFGDMCSEQSFGHSGNVGTSFAFADPDRSVAIAAVFNGLLGHEAAFLRRRSLIRAIYLDLDDDADVAVADEAPTRRRGFRRRHSTR